jgi:alpha-ketoglutarate-dependent taurine dioxygenase
MTKITVTRLTDAFAAEIGGADISQPLARQSNLDIKTGEVIPSEDRRMIYQLANMFWHTDSSFKVYPPVRHPLVRTNPVNGRKTLFLGAHASHIEGLPVDEGRALLKELLAHVTQPAFCYRHAWTVGDLIVWDNRCVLHRATPFDAARYKRLMQRTTIGGGRDLDG